MPDHSIYLWKTIPVQTRRIKFSEKFIRCLFPDFFAAYTIEGWQSGRMKQKCILDLQKSVGELVIAYYIDFHLVFSYVLLLSF